MGRHALMIVFLTAVSAVMIGCRPQSGKVAEPKPPTIPVAQPGKEKVTEFFPSPGVLSEKTHLFVARDLTPGAMRPEADEDLEPQVVTWAQALAWVMDGTIRDAKTLVALLLWEKRSLAMRET